MDPEPDPLERVADLFSRILLEREAQEARQPVVPPRDPSDLRELLDLEPPERGQDLESVGRRLRDLVRHTPSTASSGFYNQLFAGREPAALLGEAVAAALNSSMYTYKVGGAQVLVELELVRKLGSYMGFEQADGVFTPGGSISNLCGMLLARDRARPRLHEEGFGAQRLRVYTSEESHYSVSKAMAVLGMGRKNLVRIPVDARGRICVEALVAAVQADLEAGHEPVLVNATAGTTVLGAFDPLDELADVCERFDLWLHVDGAYGGSAALDPDQAHLLRGSARADSISWDAHKLMGAPLSCSVVLVREKGLLARSLDEDASYLFQGDEAELDPGTRSVQCGRRNDALKLWTLWQAVGSEGFAARLAGLRRMALVAADLVRGTEGLELVREPEFLNVCFRVEGVCAKELCAELTRRGLAMVGYALVDDDAVVRLVVANPATDEADLERLFGQVREVARDMRAADVVRAAS